MRDRRPYPVIPTGALTVTLVLGAVLRTPSLLHLQSQTKRPGWQRLIGRKGPLSDDTFAYVLERYRLEDLRTVLAELNRRLKANKQFEAAKIHGLLVVSLDANEQFSSRSRCCAQCSQRKVEILNAQGEKEEVIEYYHRQVYAHIQGPKFSVILDLEPIRPGEEEAGAALRLLGRMRRIYGVRFFDVVTVDAWYAKGPFLKAVQRLGWAVVSVLKQERYEIYQEATALSRQQEPLRWKDSNRQIQLWEVKDLPFTEESLGAIRVVLAQENWRQARRVGGRKVLEDKQTNWRWMSTRELDGYESKVIWEIGHYRWGIENHAFNELTQAYHLEHCPHHEPVAIVAWLLILSLAFNAFEVFARVHGKLLLAGQTLLEIVEDLKTALGRWEELAPLWSG